MTTEDANALRALFGTGQGDPLTPIVQFENNPKFFSADATLQKRFTFGRHGVRFTAEAFNMFNIPQRTAPNQSLLSPLFGSYTAVSSPRAVQFTAQYDF